MRSAADFSPFVPFLSLVHEGEFRWSKDRASTSAERSSFCVVPNYSVFLCFSFVTLSPPPKLPPNLWDLHFGSPTPLFFSIFTVPLWFQLFPSRVSFPSDLHKDKFLFFSASDMLAYWIFFFSAFFFHEKKFSPFFSPVFSPFCYFFPKTLSWTLQTEQARILRGLLTFVSLFPHLFLLLSSESSVSQRSQRESDDDVGGWHNRNFSVLYSQLFGNCSLICDAAVYLYYSRSGSSVM